MRVVNRSDEIQTVRRERRRGCFAVAGSQHVCHPSGRFDALTDGEGIADLIADLKQLAQLVIDAELALELVNEDPDALAAALEKARKKVAAALINDHAGRTISANKDVRDRLAVLVEDAIDEIRAFAAVAFHDDPTHERRGAFASLTPHRRLRH